MTKKDESQIKKIRSKSYSTLRATSPAIEKILYKPIKVLDHGFIRVIDYMGTDQSIVQAARVSYGEGTKKLREDRGLIRYLLSHWHTTPFEMCEIKFHVKLPIFVARQWIRHRTANVNEYSARYSVLDREFYVPEINQLGSQSTTNKQGRSESLNKNFAKQAQKLIKDNSNQLYDDYQNLLNGNLLNKDEYEEGEGLARELARTTLPLNYYTQWYWKVDLHNLMHFLKLRADSHAQYEIQIYAEKMIDVLKKWVPLTYEAFEDYRNNSYQLSKEAIKILKDILAGKKINIKKYKLSPRELRELETRFSVKILKD
jgi:thymidylate synthase (FAD)